MKRKLYVVLMLVFVAMLLSVNVASAQRGGPGNRGGYYQGGSNYGRYYYNNGYHHRRYFYDGDGDGFCDYGGGPFHYYGTD